MDIEFALESWRLELRSQRTESKTIDTWLVANSRLAGSPKTID